MHEQKAKEFLEKHLQYSWLRPENALINTMRSLSLLSAPLNAQDKAIDISCGDGVSSFIAYGGSLNPKNDMFQSMNIDMKREPDKDHFDNFDAESFKIDVIEQPEHFFDTGTDWKTSMLDRAGCLKAYKNLVQHDNNQQINFSDESFSYIYTNSIYWVDSIHTHFNDLSRLCQKDGLILLHVKTPTMFTYHASHYATMFGTKFADIINAGRHNSYKGLLSLEDYIQLGAENTELTTEAVIPVYDDIIGKIWDIGLRPLFPPLYKMSQHVPENELIEIKKEWVQQLYDLLEEFVCGHKPNAEKAMEFLIIFRKKR